MSIKYIFLIIAALSIVSAAYFGVEHYNKMTAENAELKIEIETVKNEKAELERQHGNIVDAVDANDVRTTQIIERTKILEREINDAPITKDCLNTPAIRLVVERLRNAPIEPSAD